MRFLITGSTGYLGHAITPILARTHDVYAGYFNSPVQISKVTPLRLNITRHAEIASALDIASPDTVIHCAALTKPDHCELNPADAQSVNVDATRFIASECHRRGIQLIH